MWQTTFFTCGSSKTLTQTLSLGDSRLKVVLTQSISAARAVPPAAQKSSAAAAIRNSLIFLSDSGRNDKRVYLADFVPGRNASVKSWSFGGTVSSGPSCLIASLITASAFG